MASLSGKSIGLVGALSAFPVRLAAREAARHGAKLRRVTGRNTSIVVFGRKAITRYGREALERRILDEHNAGRELLSENGFLRRMELSNPAESGTLSLDAFSAKSSLGVDFIRFLTLFDAFVSDSEPYTMRDLILARKYAGLVAGDAGWLSICRAIHRRGEIRSLTALSLMADGDDAILARFERNVGELDGQYLLPVDSTESEDADTCFAAAEEAEAAGDYRTAILQYGRCLEFDPSDPVAAYNRANCLREIGDAHQAALGYLQAAKNDPQFAEAWFNHAGLRRDMGDTDQARRHFHAALRIDPDYADAAYNLATLEFEADRLAEARQWWKRYLELDRDSDWSKNAERGIRYIDQTLADRRAG